MRAAAKKGSLRVFEGAIYPLKTNRSDPKISHPSTATNGLAGTIPSNDSEETTSLCRPEFAARSGYITACTGSVVLST